VVKIKLEKVYKKYEAEQYSVIDFNLEIADREFIVFVGPSGCGKSTTLRMIAGLEEITKGTLMIGKEVMNQIAPKDRNIAMVFQNYALYPHMTVFDNLAFGLKLRKYEKNEIKKRVEKAATALELTECLMKKPAALSGGQRQRVALGRAIVRNAQVFLMDEPLSNLDAKLRVSMRAEIAKLHRQLKTTTIYVTHDQTEAMTMADRIVIMNKGIIQQVGTPQEVYHSPVNKFVASFIGAPAMNLFEMTLSDGILSDGQGLLLPILQGQREKLESMGYNFQKIIFGIRPEDIHCKVLDMKQETDAIVQGEVIVSELLGSEVMLHLKSGKTEYISKESPNNLYQTGTVLDLAFKLEQAHFFDFKTEKVLDWTK
jgi:multiple sugar transport system ATP-binding protein